MNGDATSNGKQLIISSHQNRFQSRTKKKDREVFEARTQIIVPAYRIKSQITVQVYRIKSQITVQVYRIKSQIIVHAYRLNHNRSEIERQAVFPTRTGFLHAAYKGL